MQNVMVAKDRAILTHRTPSVHPSKPNSFYQNLLPIHPATTAAQMALRSQLIEVLKVQDMIGGRIPIGRLWPLLNSADSEVEDCVALIELDPLLKEKVLRLVNLSIDPDHVDTATLSSAIFQLGFSKIRQLTFNTSVYRQFAKYGRPQEWDHFWARSLFVARTTQRICAGYMRTDGSEYVAGILQNVGWLLLHKFFAREFRQIFATGDPIPEAESRILPNTHAEISGALCALSALPDRIVQAVSLYPTPLLRNFHPALPENSPEFLAAVLHLANDLADLAGFPFLQRRKIDLESVQQSEEAVWLEQFGSSPDYALILREESAQTRDLYPLFFGEKIAA